MYYRQSAAHTKWIYSILRHFLIHNPYVAPAHSFTLSDSLTISQLTSYYVTQSHSRAQRYCTGSKVKSESPFALVVVVKVSFALQVSLTHSHILHSSPFSQSKISSAQDDHSFFFILTKVEQPVCWFRNNKRLLFFSSLSKIHINFHVILFC